MKNQDFDKLKCIEHIVAVAFGTTSKKEELLALPEIKSLLQFFKISYEELVVLSLLIEGGIRQEEQGSEQDLDVNIISYRGGFWVNILENNIIPSFDELLLESQADLAAVGFKITEKLYPIY